jgi:class 3 adenylate cyclase/tetratricopeptide (TPR) repeat protein
MAGNDLTLPPNLEDYLPPDLWRKLTADAPRRGVLLSALDRLRSILYLLSTYLPSHLVQEKMHRPVPGLVRGQLLNGTLLFADVSGFTALSERLAVLGQEGAERLTDLMNRYFSTMLEILSWSGGILLKFAGDATLVYFPEQRAGEQVHWAVRAGQRMMRAMADFAAVETPLGTLGLQMKMGVGTGHFLAASVGSAERMEYVVLGGAVTQTMAAEGVAEAGQVIVDEATAVGLDPSRCLEQAAGFYAVRPGTDRDLDDFEIKAEKRRARGAMPWSASPHAIVTQMEVALRQIQALTPYLAAELADRIVARARQRQVESEYRPTAVLFINFTGLETLLSAWGQGGVRRVTRLLSDYFNAMHQVIARHGGIVSRIDPYSRGSKMLVLFGAPVAHEDDPQRAVNVALAMGAELAMLNDRWRHTLASHLTPELDGPLIQQRSGITQGLTFAGQVGSSTRREYTVMGDDVNLAARLMASAQPGQVLLSQHVYDAVVDYFAATTLDPVHVKGKSQPIPVYQVEGPRDDPLARRLRSRGPLVGRDAELEQGQAVLRQALARQGTMLTIRGPAGVGKSHLADELAAHGLARGARVLFSEGWSYTAEAPYTPWTTFLQALAGIALADRPQVCSEKLLRMLTELSLPHDEYADPLANLLGLQRAASAAVPRQPVEALAAPPQPQAEPPQKLDLFERLEQEVAERGENGLDLWRLAQERQQAQPGQMWQRLQTRVTAHERTRLFEAVCGLIRRLSADAPLLLFFENAQWMDPASRELLSYLNERLYSWPILVLVVQRSEDEDEPIQDARGGQTLTLGPLSLEGTTALVTHLLGDGSAQTDLAHAIHEQSGGNPLFVEEIVRWLERTGQKDLDDLKGGLWTSGTFQELVLSRLDSLPQGQRDTAKAASVVGNEFCRGELGPLLPSTIDDATLNDYLSGLEDARLILLTEVGDDARYAFRQTLIREVVYESQPFAQRRELHGRMASHLEADHADDLVDYAELLAHHYYLAHRWLPAARYLLLSGYKARQQYAYPQAAGYYSQVLAALERLPPREVSPETMALKAEAHEGQGDVAVLLNDFAAAAAAYDAARSSLSDEDPARLLVNLALVRPTQGQAAEAEACARRAWAAHEAAGDLATAATLAWLLWRADDAEAGDWIERVPTLTAQGSGPWTAAVAALMTDLAGDWASAQQAYLALDEPVGAALAACRLGDQHLRQGDVAGALALYNQAAETWDQESDACGLALARYRQAEAYLRSEGTPASRAALHEALGLLDACATATQDDRETVQKALAAVDAGQTGVWPPWRWQRYDDVFCISILFQP